MSNSRQVKRVWEARTIGKNRRGIPKQSWNNSVAEILQRKEMNWRCKETSQKQKGVA